MRARLQRPRGCAVFLVPHPAPLIPVNGQFGLWHTKGLQEGEDPAHLKTAVTLKHWDAYSLEDSDGYTRDNFNAVVSSCVTLPAPPYLARPPL